MIQVMSPNENAMSYQEVAQLVCQLGKDLVGKDFVFMGDLPKVEETKPLEGKTEPLKDATKPDIDTSALIAAVDQAEAQKTGEANEPPSERESAAEQEVVTPEETKVEAPAHKPELAHDAKNKGKKARR